MDDGVECSTSPHANRQGIPVCCRGNVCDVTEPDQFLSTDSAWISAIGRERLAQFFQQAGATSYIITGLTDVRASDEYNMKRSYNSAFSVARIAQSAGARIADVHGYGERMPAVSNKTAHASKRIAALKAFAFIKGTENDLCKNYYGLDVGCLFGRV